MIKAELRGVWTGLALVAICVLLLISFRTPIPGISVLQTLRFHIVVSMLALPVLLLVQGARLRALVLLCAIGASGIQGVMHVLNQQKARWIVEAAVDPAPVKIVSYNVLAINPRPDEVVDYLIQTSPDVMVIMEAPGIESLLARLDEHFPYRAGCSEHETCDLAVFSRTPIRNVSVNTLDFDRERLVTVETTVRGRSITVVGAHLSKPYFDKSAWAEMWKITHHLRTLSGPVVLAGDFNAAAWSDDVRWFVERSNLVPPPIYPATWPVRLGPFGLPIDNMFTQGGALIQAIEATPDPIGSNHRGLIAEIALPQLQAQN